MCNTCCTTVASFKKLRFCQFCAQANCAQCVTKSRPYPKNNPERKSRGQVCIQCDKKFLYRDALHESQIKLELRDQRQGRVDRLLRELEIDYERAVNELN